MIFTLGSVVAFFLGWLLFHITRHRCDPHSVVDTEKLSVYMLCSCGKKSQYDFMLALEGKKDWIGYQHGENQCSLCLGWKPKAWKFCAIKICKLNPEHGT